jgi:hypothetical protein
VQAFAKAKAASGTRRAATTAPVHDRRGRRRERWSAPRPRPPTPPFDERRSIRRAPIGPDGTVRLRCYARHAGTKARSPKDPDAGFSRRGQRSFFGFKAHLAVDLGSDLVRGAILTGADVGDNLAADALVQGDEAAALQSA